MPTLTKKRPPKPYAKFPLFPHNDGSWAKKIKGRHVRFGVWRWPDRGEYEASWRAALEAFHRYEEAVARNEVFVSKPRAIDLGALCDAYLAGEHAKAESGEIKARSFAERRKSVTHMRDFIGEDVTVEELENDARPIQQYIEQLERSLGYHQFNNTIQRLRSMWKWAADPKKGVLDGVVFRELDRFTKRKVKIHRRQVREAREQGKRTSFMLDEIRALLQYASEPMRTWVLLGYFASYGNTDLAEMPDSAMTEYAEDLKIYIHGRHEVIPAGWATLYFPRPKTECDRWAIVPPSVVAALNAARAKRVTARDKADAGKMFLTGGGRKVVYEVVHKDANGLIKRVNPVDQVEQHWRRLIRRIGRCKEHGWQARINFTRNENAEGEKLSLCPECEKPMEMMTRRGFYCLRHTSTTRAAVSGASSDTRNLFEGHSSGSVRQAFYLDPTQLHDLFLIARDLAAAIGLNESVAPASAVVATAPAEAVSQDAA